MLLNKPFMAGRTPEKMLGPNIWSQSASIQEQNTIVHVSVVAALMRPRYLRVNSQSSSASIRQVLRL